jgi:hypothetical protein
MNEHLLSDVFELIPPLLQQSVDFFAVLVDEELEEEEEVMERLPRIPRREGFLKDKLSLSPEAFKDTFRMSGKRGTCMALGTATCTLKYIQHLTL